MKKLFLLDAYALIYRAYYGFINRPLINSKGNNTSAIFGFVKTLEEVLKKENPDFIGVAFDVHGPTFRHEAFPEYKAQREETPDGIKFAVPVIKEVLAAYNIPVLGCEGYEADDVIGTLATQAQNIDDLETYMMTPDKDYGQLVKGNVRMYKPRHDGGYDILGEEDIKQKYGIQSTTQVIDLLGLMGDSSDNFPGCPGVGEKTAVKLITEFGSIDGLLANIEEHELRSLIKGKEKAHSPILPPKNKNGQLDMFAATPSPTKGKSQPQILDLFADNSSEDSNNSILSDYKTIGAKYQLVDSEEEMKNLAAKLLSAKEFALDTETASWDKNDKTVDPMKAELVGLSFSITENEGYYVPIPAERSEAISILQIFEQAYASEFILKIGHNIKYDMIVLSHYDITVGGPLFDTMIADYVLYSERPHKMDSLAEAYLKYKTIHYEDVVGSGRQQKTMREVSPSEVVNYAAEDADVTLKLKHILEKELEQRRLTELFEDIEMPLVRVLMRMEMYGARIDTTALKETSALFTEKMLEIEREIHDIAGTELNISSPKQIGELLFDKLKLVDKAKKTKKGQYVTDEHYHFLSIQERVIYTLPTTKLSHPQVDCHQATQICRIYLFETKTARK